MHSGIELTSLVSPSLAGQFFNTSFSWEAYGNNMICLKSDIRQVSARRSDPVCPAEPRRRWRISKESGSVG